MKHVDIPVDYLQACKWENLNKSNPTWNRSAIDCYIYIQVPAEVLVNCALYQVYELTSEGCKEAPEGAIVRDVNCWLKGTSSLMNMTAGLHTYKLSFVDRITNVSFDLFINYTVQDDNPDKPYIYMKREETNE